MGDSLFSVSGFDISAIQLIFCSLVILSLGFLYYKQRNYAFFDEIEGKLQKMTQHGFKIRLGMTLLFLSILLVLRILNIDFNLLDFNNFQITINHIAEILSLFSVALLFDWIISHVVIRNRFRKRAIPKRNFTNDKFKATKATKLVRSVVYLYLSHILIKRLELDAIIFQRDLKGEIFTVHISDILVAIMIMMLARIIIWFIIQISLYRMYSSKDMDEGIQYAINQLVTYVIYVIAFLFALDRIVSDMSIIYGGAAALLVGVGLGLQQTFNDFFSGLVLLFERTVMVGDVLEIDGQVGRILKIGLRASRIETRNSVSMLVPNSKLVNQSVINWTHYDNVVRFQVDVGVAYGTEAALVKKLLLEAPEVIPDVLKEPAPFVRLNDFGDNGIIFSLYFFSTQIMMAENVKSDVRFEIDRIFRANNITIPFPQRDIRIISAPENIQ